MTVVVMVVIALELSHPSGVAAPGHCFIYEEDEADVWHDVEEVGSEATIEALEALVPPGLLDAVPEVVILRMLVLHAGPQHLVGVGGDRCKQLGQGGKGEVFHHGLWERRKRFRLPC